MIAKTAFALRVQIAVTLSEILVLETQKTTLSASAGGVVESAAIDRIESVLREAVTRLHRKLANRTKRSLHSADGLSVAGH